MQKMSTTCKADLGRCIEGQSISNTINEIEANDDEDSNNNGSFVEIVKLEETEIVSGNSLRGER